MGISTKIEYCHSTVNPVMGCSGCELYSPDPSKTRCYAHLLILRRSGMKGWPIRFEEPMLWPERIETAARWPSLCGETSQEKPWLDGYCRVVFVNDLGDGFSPSVNPSMWLHTLNMARMESSPHTWLLLTKWPKLMAQFFEEKYKFVLPNNFAFGTTITSSRNVDRFLSLLHMAYHSKTATNFWISFEPLRSSVALDIDRVCVEYHSLGLASTVKVLRNMGHTLWFAAGGESGSNGRPSHPSWFAELRDISGIAGIPFFFKQWGAWIPAVYHISGYAGYDPPTACVWPNGRASNSWSLWNDGDGAPMVYVGRKDFGRKLYGSDHSEMPSWRKK